MKDDYSSIRIAKLATDDLAYPAGARWAVLGLKWVWPEVPEGGRMIGAKVANLEAALELALRAAVDPELIDRVVGAQGFSFGSDPAPARYWRMQLDFYRSRRKSGHEPKPPAAWSDIFKDAEANHA